MLGFTESLRVIASTASTGTNSEHCNGKHTNQGRFDAKTDLLYMGIRYESTPGIAQNGRCDDSHKPHDYAHPCERRALEPSFPNHHDVTRLDCIPRAHLKWFFLAFTNELHLLGTGDIRKTAGNADCL